MTTEDTYVSALFGKVEQFLDAKRGTTMNAEFSWTEPYRAAMTETDDTSLLTRLRVAKAAIDDRLQHLRSGHGGTPDERQAIIDALSWLNVLRGELETRSLH